MSVQKTASALERLERAKTLTAYAFVITTVVTIAGTVLRDAEYLRPAYYGFVLNLWSLAGVAWAVSWCAYHMCKRLEEREARHIRRAKAIQQEVAALKAAQERAAVEVAKVAELTATMEEDKNVRRINRR